MLWVGGVDVAYRTLSIGRDTCQRCDDSRQLIRIQYFLPSVIDGFSIHIVDVHITHNHGLFQLLLCFSRVSLIMLHQMFMLASSGGL